MSEIRRIYGFIEKQVNLYRKFWVWEVTWMFYSIVTALSIGLIGVGMNQITNGNVDTHQVTLYLLVGSIVWSYLALVFWEISHTISWERWEGTIEYTFMAPVSRISHLVGTSIFALFYGVARTSIVFVIAVLFFRISFAGLRDDHRETPSVGPAVPFSKNHSRKENRKNLACDRYWCIRKIEPQLGKDACETGKTKSKYKFVH